MSYIIYGIYIFIDFISFGGRYYIVIIYYNLTYTYIHVTDQLYHGPEAQSSWL